MLLLWLELNKKKDMYFTAVGGFELERFVIKIVSVQVKKRDTLNLSHFANCNQEEQRDELSQGSEQHKCSLGMHKQPKRQQLIGTH